MKKLLMILAAIGLAVAYSSCETTDSDRKGNRHTGGQTMHNMPQ